ncbi:hypothetical protein [Streptomyces lunaelactis]|uniref:hypothetical protein n=2 Tax=Streptomyces lunaelactis TaxID=1535768 RepID=UPI001585C0DC|nr:hypothetical protein [Streptomyces lunaelactis]NUK03766.1 hypothetical protein [Streptomyces lunaelactis]NUK16331.1 hypothetical protein [Streptomyces lunaelactis]NUK58021.1 hypothetical protein [Streptomyces lunaelactis]
MSLSSRIVMPGQIWSVAAQDPSGPLYVTSHGSSPLETVVTMVDVSGAVHWEKAYAGTGHPRSRLSADGTLWLAYPRDKGGRTLEGILPDGSMGRTILLPCDTGEEVAAFVVLNDGFCISWAGASRMLLEAGHQPSHPPRVARYTMEGHCVWSTPIGLGTVSHPGVVGMSAETDWEIQPVKPWAPRLVEAAYSEPLLVSGDRIAASFTDESSGIGRTFFLDLVSGTVVGATNPAPSGRKAISGPGEFLIGSQGYGQFTMSRFDRNGRETSQWASHGAMTVDSYGTIRGPELSNSLAFKLQFRQLAPANELLDGPPLAGYYTSHPALDCDGTSVFWRDGKLLAVDAEMTLHELFAMDDSRNIMGRTLLLDGGRVALSLDSEIVVFQTQLGALAGGPWPCGDANLLGNPVLS